ncbi:MAG: hypothetical protein M1127_01985 [Patescibacteria group bacterium]|nr:hypothetical protein [Patescibacteria group bacterium]
MLKVFELKFNNYDGNGTGQADTFCFFPSQKTEKRLGVLCLLSELRNPDFHNRQLLEKLTDVIAKEHRANIFMPTQAFQQALNKANEFLQNELQQNNPSWLGNLNLTAISASDNHLSLKISKTGQLKALLFRGEEAFDIGGNLRESQTSGKFFPEVIEGKLENSDRVLAATSEVFEALKNEGIAEGLAFAKNPKEIKKIFKQKKKILKQFSGACLIIFVKKTFFSKTFHFFDSLSANQKRAVIGSVSVIILALLSLLGYFVF